MKGPHTNNNNNYNNNNHKIESACCSDASCCCRERSDEDKQEEETFYTPCSSFSNNNGHGSISTCTTNSKNDQTTQKVSSLVPSLVPSLVSSLVFSSSPFNLPLPLVPPSSFSPEIESIKASLSSKASPFTLSSWIVVALTLDGRDKITKIIQYTSRFLGYYYETMASAVAVQASISGGGEGSVYASYLHKAKKFRNLYKAMNTSRKAYRFGRTFIELDKLRSMGFIHWIAWYLRSNMFLLTHSNNKEEHDVNTKSSREDKNMIVSFHPNTKFKQQFNDNSHGINQNQITTTVPTPPKIRLPRQISSNVGFKPSPYDVDFMSIDSKEEKYVQRLSYIGKFLYRSLSSLIDEEKISNHKPLSSSSSTTTTTTTMLTPPPPFWKVFSSALKLLGLAGFWTGDNITYLYSIGFLTHHDHKISKKRQDSAAIFAMRSYFFGALAGLYLNSREWIQFRNGTFVKLSNDIHKLKMEMRKNEALLLRDDNTSENYDNDDNHNHTNKAYEEHHRQDELIKLEKKLEVAKQKYFTICLALLKSCCDVTVFSNNPGVDLHLKYRGRKMNEGFQCICGVISALTVIYNNFPSVNGVKK